MSSHGLNNPGGSLHPSPILYVEDEENDALLMRFGFEAAGLADRLVVVGDGKSAIDYLAGNGIYSDRTRHPLPILMILDLNLPRISGFDVLRWLRAEPFLQQLPVVILTSSSSERDLETANSIGVEGFIIKDGDIANIAKMAEMIKSRWLAVSV